MYLKRAPHSYDEFASQPFDFILQQIASLRNITWLMSNLFRNKNPCAPFDKVSVMLPHLARLLLHQDSQVVTDAAWAISYVTDDDNHKIQAVIDHGCVPPLVQLLERDDASIIVPSLRSIGNIVTGNDHQVRRIEHFFISRNLLLLLNDAVL